MARGGIVGPYGFYLYCVVSPGGKSVVTFYSAAVSIVLAVVVLRFRGWLMRDVKTGFGLFYVSRPRRVSRQAKRPATPKIQDLSVFDNIDYASFKPSTEYAAMKRVFDVVICAGLLIALAPLIAVTAIAIKLETPGPALYRQKRVGLGGKVFEVFKFRSMRNDAEKDGPRWAQTNDDRITRVGRFIRKFRIDEIPQTINVLKGEMSFVGPRPERPEFVGVLEQEIPHYHLRHVLKPGITGWAQVKHEYTASVEGALEKLKYDLFYVKKFTPILDIIILVLTVRVVLLGQGSR